VGKSTLLAALAAEFNRPVLDLDRPDARAAAASDPSFIVSGPGPVLIDEFQRVPDIATRSSKEERIMVMPLSGLWSLNLKPEPARSV
jgi:hypothetical protein